ncbi:MAG: SgcJ/EcaC family oxidoreductase [Acidobacteriota bacterium]
MPEDDDPASPRREDSEVDEALDESFPASDPRSWSLGLNLPNGEEPDHPPAPHNLPARFANAWNAHDAEALAGLFADNADFVNVVGLWWRDRDAIRKAHAYGFKVFFAQARLDIEQVEVRRLGLPVAVIHARWKLTGQTPRSGGRATERQGVLQFVAERQGHDDWIIVAAQNTERIRGAETFEAGDGSVQPA